MTSKKLMCLDLARAAFLKLHRWLTKVLWIVYFILFLSSQNVSYADDTTQNLPEISEKLGTKIDLNLKFVDDEGNTKTLKEMFEGKSTLIITLNYFRCTTMCTYQFLNLAESLQKVGLAVGDGYTIASISFDPTDDIKRAQYTREIWLKKLGVLNAPWRFYTTDNTVTVKKLADSLNFYFEKDDQGNFSHTAGLFFISDDGTLKRYLYGIVYTPLDIKYALIETSNGKIGSLFDKLRMKFSQYNASRGRYE